MRARSNDTHHREKLARRRISLWTFYGRLRLDLEAASSMPQILDENSNASSRIPPPRGRHPEMNIQLTDVFLPLNVLVEYQANSAQDVRA